MQTYSHFLMTALLRHVLHRRRVAEPGKAFLTGSISPDVPLALFSAGYVVDRRIIRRHLPDKTRCSPTYNDLYFNNPWWIAAYNILHAPLPVLILGLLGYWGRGRSWGRRLFWFAAGCSLHAAVDILTHADDGPVLSFPLDWHRRFRSPLSYWDPGHGGRLFRRLEHLLDLVMVGYLIIRRRSAKSGEAQWT
jgi:hypothetical protein